MASEASGAKQEEKKSQQQKTNEKIVNGFQMLRTEQRNLAVKLTEFETDLNEHKLVIQTLEKVDGDRKCFRLIGGVLCERSVKEVLPQLQVNVEQLSKVIEAVKEQITKKGIEINEYKEKHNIWVRGVDEISNEPEEKSATSSSRGNMLVVNPI